MNSNSEYIKISSGKRPQIQKAHLMSVSFVDGDHTIIYIPSINVSAYGSNFEEADEMMKVSIHEAMLAFNRLSHAELIAQLKSYGWERNVFYKTDLSKSAHIDKEGILRDFELSEETHLTERLVTV